MIWVIYLSLDSHLCLIWATQDKSLSIITLANADSLFITEYHFPPIVHIHVLAHFNLISFYLCVSAGFHLTFSM